MADQIDISEFPAGYAGRKTYVPVQGQARLVACCYVYRGGDGRYHIHPDFGGTWAGLAARSDTIKLPYLVKDIGEYQSPIDGQLISTRSQHRDHLKAHQVEEVGNEKIGSMTRPDTPVKTREIGERIKHHLDTVKAMPQKQYDDKVRALAHGE